jgi:hypothetical protein
MLRLRSHAILLVSFVRCQTKIVHACTPLAQHDAKHRHRTSNLAPASAPLRVWYSSCSCLLARARPLRLAEVSRRRMSGKFASNAASATSATCAAAAAAATAAAHQNVISTIGEARLPYCARRHSLPLGCLTTVCDNYSCCNNAQVLPALTRKLEQTQCADRTSKVALAWFDLDGSSAASRMPPLCCS